MKTLLLHISDIHCKENDHRFNNKIDKVVEALRQLEKFEKVLLIVSGDLTERASKNEFKLAKSLIGQLLSKLDKDFNCGYINTLLVPGNHDILLSEGCREAKDILEWNKGEHLSSELEQMESFFDYANSKKCFKTDKICDVRCISIGDSKVQICLLNSAPYSTLGKDNQQLHYLPSYVAEKLNRLDDVDLKITVMHHSYEWCEWETKSMIKKALTTDDIVFFGHDHVAENLNLISGDGKKFNIVKGGRFDLDINKKSAFNALIWDDESSNILIYEFNWDINTNVFIKKDNGNFNIKTVQMRPTKEYCNKLLDDKQHISELFTDYYVLPKLLPEGTDFFDTHSERISVEEIFNALKKEKVIRISGNNGLGKSSLLKYLYAESINRGYLPLFVEKRDYTDSRIEKMFRDMFELQYGTIEQGYNIYDQHEHSKEIIFIDDMDLIENSKACRNLIEYIMNSGRLLVYSATDKNQDLENLVIDRLQGKSLSSLEILPFYKETRDELIDNICRLLKKNDKDAVIMAMDYMVQCQTSLFSFAPGSLIQYIKYFLNNGSMQENKGVKTIPIVFETNIRNSIIEQTKEHSANIYLSLLEFIANKMYFEEKSENISIVDFQNIVLSYNKKRKANVNPKYFFETCKKAKILKESNNSFDISFCDKNTFAYFIAKYVNRSFEKDSNDQEKLKYIMEHICFGINDTIILFLSFIRSNTKIILQIASEATKLLSECQEWDFDKDNIPFLKQSGKLSNEVPNDEDKRKTKENTERIEKDKQETIKFRGIFDFNEEDVNTERYIVLRALKYTQIVGRALVDQYGSLDTDEIEKMIQLLYSIPQKVIFSNLKFYQEHQNEIVENILEFAKQEIPNVKITKDYVKKMLGQAGIVLALNIMNDIAYNSSNSNTIVALRDFDIRNSNDKIMQLMMEENTGDTSTFITKAIQLKKQFTDNHFGIMLIAQIARKHIIYSDNIDYKQIDKLVSNGIFSPTGKKNLLLEQGVKKKN